MRSFDHEVRRHAIDQLELAIRVLSISPTSIESVVSTLRLKYLQECARRMAWTGFTVHEPRFAEEEFERFS